MKTSDQLRAHVGTVATFLKELPEVLYLNVLLTKAQIQLFFLRRTNRKLRLQCGILPHEPVDLVLKQGDAIAQDLRAPALVDPVTNEGEQVHTADSTNTTEGAQR